MGDCKWLPPMFVAAIWRKLAAVSGLGGQYWGCQQDESTISEATPIATTPSQHLPQSLFARPAEQATPELIGCRLVRHQPDGEPLRLARL